MYTLRHPQANWGKTTTVDIAFRRYRAYFVQDPKNVMGIPETTQIIILDEVDPAKKPDLATLKGLTSGNASRGAFNRKSYGPSFIPVDDTQIIVLSNHSPYEVYAKYDTRLHARICHKGDIEPVLARFKITRLDGEDCVEKFKWMDPADMDEDVYHDMLKEAFYSRIRGANATGNVSTYLVKQTLCDIYNIVLKRRQGQKITYEDVTDDLDAALHDHDYKIVRTICDR
jgi:hypothetical protein